MEECKNLTMMPIQKGVFLTGCSNIHFGYGPHESLENVVSFCKNNFKGLVPLGFLAAIHTDDSIEEYWLLKNVNAEDLQTSDFVPKNLILENILKNAITMNRPKIAEIYLEGTPYLEEYIYSKYVSTFSKNYWCLVRGRAEVDSGEVVMDKIDREYAAIEKSYGLPTDNLNDIYYRMCVQDAATATLPSSTSKYFLSGSDGTLIANPSNMGNAKFGEVDGTYKGRTSKSMKLTFKVDGTTMFTCNTDVTILGLSSADFDKKNYTLDLWSDIVDEDESTEDTIVYKKLKIAFPGMYENSSFLLKAYSTEMTHARDLGACNIYLDLVKFVDVNSSLGDPANTYTKDPSADGSEVSVPFTSSSLLVTQGFPVVVYVKNSETGEFEYWGLYTLRTKKSADLYKLDKSNLDNIFLDLGNTDTGHFYQFNIQKNGLYTMFGNFDIKCPKASNLLNASSEKYQEGDLLLNPTITATSTPKEKLTSHVREKIIQFFENMGEYANANKATYNKDLEDFLNINHWLAFIILGELVGHADTDSRNFEFVSWDGDHWSIMPYDMDLTLGLDEPNHTLLVDDERLTRDMLGSYGEGSDATNVWGPLKEKYHNELCRIYTQMKDAGFLTYENLSKYYIELVSGISADIMKKERKKWPNVWNNGTLGNKRGYTSNGTPTLEHLLLVLNKRIEYCDSKWYTPSLETNTSANNLNRLGIIGDSISSVDESTRIYGGYNRSFEKSNSNDDEVGVYPFNYPTMEAEKAWWADAIEYFPVIKNASWSASTVYVKDPATEANAFATNYDSTNIFCAEAACSTRRIVDLADPNLTLIYIGINDAFHVKNTTALNTFIANNTAAATALNSVSNTTTATTADTIIQNVMATLSLLSLAYGNHEGKIKGFLEAYFVMLSKLKTMYPKARVVCITPTVPGTVGNENLPSGWFNTNYANNEDNATRNIFRLKGLCYVHACIRALANMFDYDLINLPITGIYTTDNTTDGTSNVNNGMHPDDSGHELIRLAIAAELLPILEEFGKLEGTPSITTISFDYTSEYSSNGTWSLSRESNSNIIYSIACNLTDGNTERLSWVSIDSLTGTINFANNKESLYWTVTGTLNDLTYSKVLWLPAAPTLERNDDNSESETLPTDNTTILTIDGLPANLEVLVEITPVLGKLIADNTNFTALMNKDYSNSDYYGGNSKGGVVNFTINTTSEGIITLRLNSKGVENYAGGTVTVYYTSEDTPDDPSTELLEILFHGTTSTDNTKVTLYSNVSNVTYSAESKYTDGAVSVSDTTLTNTGTNNYKSLVANVTATTTTPGYKATTKEIAIPAVPAFTLDKNKSVLLEDTLYDGGNGASYTTNRKHYKGIATRGCTEFYVETTSSNGFDNSVIMLGRESMSDSLEIWDPSVVNATNLSTYFVVTEESTYAGGYTLSNATETVATARINLNELPYEDNLYVEDIKYLFFCPLKEEVRDNKTASIRVYYKDFDSDEPIVKPINLEYNSKAAADTSVLTLKDEATSGVTYSIAEDSDSSEYKTDLGEVSINETSGAIELSNISESHFYNVKGTLGDNSEIKLVWLSPSLYFDTTGYATKTISIANSGVTTYYNSNDGATKSTNITVYTLENLGTDNVLIEIPLNDNYNGSTLVNYTYGERTKGNVKGNKGTWYLVGGHAASGETAYMEVTPYTSADYNEHYRFAFERPSDYEAVKGLTITVYYKNAELEISLSANSVSLNADGSDSAEVTVTVPEGNTLTIE